MDQLRAILNQQNKYSENDQTCARKQSNSNNNDNHDNDNDESNNNNHKKIIMTVINKRKKTVKTNIAYQNLQD